MNPVAPCSHSIVRRLSLKLALFTMIVIGLLFATTWLSVQMLLKERMAHDLTSRCDLIADIVSLEARSGGEQAVLARLQADAGMRRNTRLQVWYPDGRLLYADASTPMLDASSHVKSLTFRIPAPGLPGDVLDARYSVDYTEIARLGQRWAWLLAVVTVAAGVLVWAGSGWHVRRQLRPLRDLAAQTRAISPRLLDQRLALQDPAEELRPWIDQFNALMERQERAYRQLEAFNADVAHELRTPLATLMGQTELALSRERSVESLRDTLVSNLEEMQRLSALVNDMLFLSQADRGAIARRGAPVSLARLASGVAEFHEATLEEAGLTLRIDGDAQVAVDEPLFKRALSNLIGNATRFAERGSTVVVAIAPEASDHVQVTVENAGAAISGEHLPQLFDRFFRADASRCCEGDAQHHGLGLAIVAAIARMHAGRTLADSSAGVTRVGFTLAAH
jgi:two-component system heavy metal sensor histidine kinase CusS